MFTPANSSVAKSSEKDQIIEGTYVQIRNVTGGREKLSSANISHLATYVRMHT